MLTKVIEQAKIDHFTKWFERADKIVIVSHVSPDGDAIGSSLGLYHFLDSQEKTVNVIVPNAFPDFLRWMPGSKDILLYDRYKDFADKLIAEADVICCLDFNALKRIDEMADAVAASPARKVMIDHHLYPEEFCKITMSYPKISSTSELVFRLICRMGYFNEITKAGAECIYTGILHDTNVFKNSNTTQRTMQVAGAMMAKGINFSRIIDESFYRKTYVQNQIMGRAVLESVLFLEGKCIFSVVRKQDMDFYGVEASDLDGIVDQLRITEGVEVAIFLYETENHVYKVSMRSNNLVNVSQVAAYFGGGGHIRAAGCTMSGSVHDVINNLSALIEKQIKENEA